jgi:hypothetical protein
VRLTVGSDVLEQPVNVRVDPTSNTSIDALRQQFVVANELRDLLSLANDTLRALDGRKAELEAKRRAALAIPEGSGAAAAKVIGTELAQVDSLLDILVKPASAPQWTGGPRISDRIGALLRNVGQGNSAPTGEQAKLGKELAIELRDALERVRKYLGRFTTM